MLRKRLFKHFLDRTCRGEVAEIVCLNSALQIIAEVGASRGFERSVGTHIDDRSLFELDLGAVVNAGNTAEGEHQIKILSPRLGTACKAVLLVGRFGRVVVGIDIHHIIGRIVVILVAVPADIVGAFGAAEHAVHLEVDRLHARRLGAVGRVVGNTLKECVVRGRFIGRVVLG